MNKITKTLSALTIASMAGAFSACSDSASTAGVTEEASGIANKDSTDNRDTTAKEPASDSFSGKISGVSQKGPFLVGSSITLHEIDGESFDLSGRTFVDKIKNDNGEFEISYKELSSKYALFIANGYYRNEVSGAKSTAPITLNALSDLSERSSANVNLFTHLEYDRIKYLIEKESLSYSEAKAQAEQEILAAFNISVKDAANAEDLSIFGETENDGALLAISVLMQGNSSEAVFSERLALVAQDLEEDGSIDDEQLKADIADGISSVDLAKVKKNILDWKLSTTIPEFESKVESFWTSVYGLGECSDENIGESKKNTNKLSKKHNDAYVCSNDGWREQNEMELSLGPCTSANALQKEFADDGIYLCMDSEWMSVTPYEYDSLALDCKKDGPVSSDLTGSYYSCIDGSIKSLAFEEMSIASEFTADIWNGATDSKAKIGDTEYALTFGVYEFHGSIYNDKGKERKVNSYTDQNVVVYDDKGESSTLGDKGIKFAYTLNYENWYDIANIATGFDVNDGSEGIDATDWDGFCLVYASSSPLLARIYGENLGEDIAHAAIPASMELTVANIKWEDFEVETAGLPSDAKVPSIENLVQNMFGVEVTVERSNSIKNFSPDAGIVYIAGYGKYNGCSVK